MMARKASVKKKPQEIPKGLARALAERKAGTDSEALLNDLIDVWGGTRQLAIDMHKEFTKAAAGGMTRQRILEMMQRLIITNTTHEIGRTIRPSDMTDDEIAEMALEYTKKALGHGTPPAADIPPPSGEG